MSLKLSIDFPEDDDETWVIERKIVDVLTDYLQPTSQLSPTDAALKFNELFRQSQNEEKANPSGFLWQVWDIVFQIGEQVPYNHASQDRLVALIAALRDAPTQPNPYAELNNIGPALTERFHQISAEPTAAGGEGGGEEDESSAWKNLNALAARLTRAGICTRARDAVVAVSLALEGRPDPRSRAYRSRGVGLNFHVPIAADWVLRCAPQLHREMQLGEPWEGGRPWKGKPGIFAERWEFWKEQFRDIATSEDACEEWVKGEARLAARRMEEVESEGVA